MRRLTYCLLLITLCTGVRAQMLFTHERQLPGAEQLVVQDDLYPFYHGVASGDPLEDRVIIWTRITPDSLNGAAVTVDWIVATDPKLTTVVGQGTLTTDASRDYTVKVDVTGLQGGTTYYYGFTALERNSLTGRTKTTPGGTTEHLRFGVVSCSNFQSGYFNAYGRLAERNDLDAVVHLGDYIYEYANFAVGVGNPAVWDDRVMEPAGEVIDLFDYRARFSTYHLDMDLMALHQQHPMIAVWDDHEFANNSYTGGATNHQEGEGPWEDRKAASKQAYFEWMPIRDTPQETVYRSLSYGTLADLIMLDTRIVGRDEQAPLTSDPDLYSPDRTMLGTTQKAWFKDRLSASTAKWKLIGNQVIFSEFNIGWAGALIGESFERAESTFLDIWDGYPRERTELIDFIKAEEIGNVVILTGDFHTSMAYEVTDAPVALSFREEDDLGTVPIYAPTPYDPATGAGAVAVEFVSPSIASANFDETTSLPIALALQGQLNTPIRPRADLNLGNPNPHMKYVDLTSHGYYILDVLEDRVQADYFYTPVLERSLSETFGQGLSSPAGGHHLTIQAAPASGKTVQDAPAPADPPGLISAVSAPSDLTVLALSPNPTAGRLNLQYAVKQAGEVRISVIDAGGREVQELQRGRQPVGLYSLRADLRELAAGAYLLRVSSIGGVTVQQFIKR
ncbi:hypothetical protein LEM8419_02162 [Neolewinella maritima]|uniref:T9SS type A sorting domain-containing protein n=1 Tax=Neolewinella maritima TaxID=1383882 RepID=A0ABN8F2Q8_9BACT|nr:alkaline phosphatase D family protein [Neolewinella maritima]CAH1001263.1 hypothetical protein LEM8419_02162 [Neolewinella maritima]